MAMPTKNVLKCVQVKCPSNISDFSILDFSQIELELANDLIACLQSCSLI